ncbi:MAG: DUF1934 domain-containing protein [Clostridia bacterium]
METIPMLLAIQANAHRDDDAEEPMSLLTSGTLILDQDSIVIQYEETLDESQPPQGVEITVADNAVTMVRTGNYGTSMVFRKGQRFEGQYHTPYGSIALAVYCTRLRCDLNREGGTLNVNYQLDLNGQFAAVHELEIRLIPQNE